MLFRNFVTNLIYAVQANNKSSPYATFSRKVFSLPIMLYWHEIKFFDGKNVEVNCRYKYFWESHGRKCLEKREIFCKNDDYILDICAELEHKKIAFHFILRRSVWVHPLRLDNAAYIDAMFYEVNFMQSFIFISSHHSF